MIVDSKTLSLAGRRDAFAALCRSRAIVWTSAAVPAWRVDLLGGKEATELAMRHAVERLERRLRRRGALESDRRAYCLVDGALMPPGLDGAAIPGGDSSETSVAAASIVASAARDASMAALARRHPLWQLQQHGGHPSGAHLHEIARYGPCDEHRLSCFPFARRFRRGLAYHPHRGQYEQVQRALRTARAPEEEERVAELGEQARQRLERYRARLRLAAAHAETAAAANPLTSMGETSSDRRSDASSGVETQSRPAGKRARRRARHRVR